MSEPARNRSILFAVALVLITIVAYIPAMRGGFVWDDDQHVIQDARLGGVKGLLQIWTEPGAIPQYYPLVHTSFWIEHWLWGLHPFGYHLVNILLHALIALLLVSVLRRLNVRGAWVAGAIFALHPVAVESVAWITERKNLLSAVFYLLAILAYLRYSPPAALIERRPRGDRRFYWFAGLCFLCALLSKTVTATLPAALLLIFWWKRGRITWRDAAPLIPFFALGFGLSYVTIWMEKHHVGAQGEEWSLTAIDRLIVAGRALFFYISKLLLPVRLTFIYPRWRFTPAQIAFPVAAITILVALFAARRRIGRGPVTAALFFAGTLVPALGFFNVFPMRYSFVADHFQYHASMAPIALAAALIARAGKRARRTIFVALVLVLAALTWHRAGAYRDVETLWRDTIVQNPGCWMAQHNLGLVYEQEGKLDLAIAQYRKALALRPDLETSHYNLATALAKQGDLEEARRHLEEAVRQRPSYAEAWNNLGNVLYQMGRRDEAGERYRRAIECDAGFLAARKNLAYAYGEQGRARESIAEYREAARIDPDDSSVLNNLAWLLATAPDPADRDPSEAVRLAESACKLTGYADVVCFGTLAAAYFADGRFKEAVSTASRAIALATRCGRSDLVPQLRIALDRYRAAGRP